MALLQLEGVSKRLDKSSSPTRSPSSWEKARRWGSSDQTGPARRRCSASSRATSSPTRGPLLSTASGFYHVGVESRACRHRTDVSSTPTFRAHDGLRERAGGRPTRRATASTSRVRCGLFRAPGTELAHLSNRPAAALGLCIENVSSSRAPSPPSRACSCWTRSPAASPTPRSMNSRA